MGDREEWGEYRKIKRMQDSIATRQVTTQPITPAETQLPDEGVAEASYISANGENGEVAETGVATDNRKNKDNSHSWKNVQAKEAVNATHEIPQYLLYPYTGKSWKLTPKHEVPQTLLFPYTGRPGKLTGSVAGKETEIAAADSVAQDSVPVRAAGEIKGGIILIDPASAYRSPKESEPGTAKFDGMSWIYLVLAVLFCITGIKFKGSSRYLKAVVSDLTDTRVRHNAFDDTVKETSLLILLNLLWTACAGILLWTTVKLTTHFTAADSISLTTNAAKGIGICIGVVSIYTSLLYLAYLIVGNVFSDRKLTRLWIKGAAASTGLQTFLMFPLALLALSYPASSATVLIIAAIVFVIGKIVFLYKGFRIFFTQISSWMLFLYYLCSLEIVPLVLTYVAAVCACTAWH